MPNGPPSFRVSPCLGMPRTERPVYLAKAHINGILYIAGLELLPLLSSFYIENERAGSLDRFVQVSPPSSALQQCDCTTSVLPFCPLSRSHGPSASWTYRGCRSNLERRRDQYLICGCRTRPVRHSDKLMSHARFASICTSGQVGAIGVVKESWVLEYLTISLIWTHQE